MGRIGTRAAWATLLGGVIASTGMGVATAAATASSQTPTLSASKHVAGLPAVTYGQSLKLSGREHHGGLRTVVLQADLFPFAAGFQDVTQERTHGPYEFTVKPSRATRYRVLVERATGSVSQVVTVYVLTRGVTTYCNLCRFTNSPGAHVLVVAGRLLPGAGIGPVYFYYGQANGTAVAPNRLPLVKAVSPRVTSMGVSFTVSYRVDFPAGLSRFRYAYCRKADEALGGYGLPGHHHCGDTTVTASEYLG